MKRAKIFFTDLDGTLLNSRKQVSRKIKPLSLKLWNKAAASPSIPDAPARRSAASGADRPEPAGLLCRHLQRGLIYDCGSGETLYKKTLPRMYVAIFFRKRKSRISMCRPTTSKA